MSVNFGRFARALLLTGGIATAIALPSIAGAPLMPSNDPSNARIAFAAPSADNDGNDDPTNDNSDERNIEGQVIELHEDTSPPEALIGMVGGDVWARMYNEQLERSGIDVGDYVHMQGEYGEHGIFDAYQVNVIDDGDDNDNGDDD
jgi:hypothetical protein